ncbi:MAG: hypothetical protein JSR89_17895 [Proteobacteria bacterium]|nr:hypothetical protein [Pseudomonadota bacterium]
MNDADRAIRQAVSKVFANARVTRRAPWSDRETEAAELAIWFKDEVISQFARSQVANPLTVHGEDKEAFRRSKDTKIAADKAATAIETLFRSLSETRTLSEASTNIRILLYQEANLSTREWELNSNRISSEFTQVLATALDVCRQLASLAESQHEALQHLQQNPGKLEEQAFAEHWCRYWVDITGKKPGNANDQNNSSFGQFLLTISGAEALSSRAVNMGIDRVSDETASQISKIGLRAWWESLGVEELSI